MKTRLQAAGARHCGLCLALVLPLAFAALTPTRAATKTWDGGATNSLWSSATNWLGEVAPVAGADDLVFAGSVGLTPTNDYPPSSTFTGVSFSSGAGAFVLSGNSLVLGGNVADLAMAAQEINLALGLGTATRTFTVGTGGQLELAQPVTGSQGVVKDGAGTLALSARSTYTGSTAISNGVVRLVSSTAPVAGMIYWLDASDLSSLTKGADNKVSQWNDRSGNGRNFTQATATLQPLYVSDALSGKPALRFDGTDDQLVFSSSTSPRSVFIVCRVAVGANLKGVWGLGGGDNGIRMTGTTAWQTPGNSNDFTSPTNSALYVNGVATNAFPTGTPHIISAIRSTAVSLAKTAVGGYYSGRYFNGDIAEVIVYDRVLTNAERAQVEAYLAAKWLGASVGQVSTLAVSGSVFWLDAANTGTVVCDASNRISRWNDAGAGGGPSYASQATTNLQPTLVPYGLNGLPIVDFGPYSGDVNGSQTNCQWLGFDAQMSTVRTVFWVGRGQNFILGDDTNYDFHRGGETATSTIWHSTYAASAVKSGQTYLNGASVNGTTTALPDAFSILSVITTNNCEASRIASDRVYRAGGQKVAELILYDRALTPQERLDTESYLSNKWFGATGSGNCLPTITAVNLGASGAVLDLNGVSQTIGSLAGVAGSSVTLGLGSLTAGGDNSSTAFAGVISGSGSLVKEGTGTLTLAGVNTFNGNTLVNRGTVKLAAGASSAASGTVRVAAGAVLDVSATSGLTITAGKRLSGSGSVTGLVTVATGGTLAPGSSVGTLTLQSGLTLQSNALVEVELGTPSDQVRIIRSTFTANTNGPAQINVLGAGTLGRFTILDWNGTTTSNVSTNAFVLGTTPSGFISSLQIVTNSLQLVVAPTGPQSIATNTIASLRLAINDLASRYATDYGPLAPGFLARLTTIEANYLAALGSGNQTAIAAADLAYQMLKRDALILSNPALRFNRLLFVKRGADDGLPSNWQNVTSVGRTACDDRICLLDITNSTVSDFYVPAAPSFLGYLNVHWNGDRLLFTGQYSTNSVNTYAVFEMKLDGTGLTRVSPSAGSDVDWFDACYLPCGELLMVSTAPFAGVPCVTGSDFVGNLYRVNPTNGIVRQLTFDQDQNWGPTILSDGRVMFTRWEYSDTPHYFSRILFTMMPDGLEQFARYGSGSYFPNTLFDARPIPGKPSQFVAILSGHHGVAREGEMVLFDETKGTFEADGAVHRFCGPNPVLPEVHDTYVNDRNPWPRFVQPAPLDEKQMVVSARTASANKWGIYLVDQFDNITVLNYQDSGGLMHPTPIRVDQVPPVIPDRVKTNMTTGTVNISDLHFGPGLAGVPRGKVKNLRVYSVHYGYRGQGGHVNIGVDGPWDVHRILGTVPVYEDGSASFTAPANVPISVQPLDDEGKALAVFRSWYTVMPGESVSCAGCHEVRNAGMVNHPTIASRKGPDSITPWNGPERGFSFLREVQPVLDQHCVGCHGGTGGPTNAAPDLSNTNRIAPPATGNTFPVSYLNLHRYVRRPGNEGYFRLNNPAEWHADTSELTQILQKGHYGVALGSNAWSRLVTWMDLNVPAWGLWGEHKTIGGSPNYHDRRLQLAISYAGVTNDPEAYPTPAPGRGTFVAPTPPPVITPVTPPTNTVFDVLTARARRNAATNSATPAELTIDLGGSVSLVLDLIPAGAVLMGSANNYRDEAPQTVVTNSQPFYMGKFEIMNKQYALFDPTHRSGFVNIIGKDHCTEGWPCNNTNQPVLRVSWADAMKFCEWLTKKTGRRFTLPTEAQWEYACRAGTTSNFWWGTAATAWTNQVQLISGDSFYRTGPLANLAGVEYFNDCAPEQTYKNSTPPWFMCNTNITDAWVAPADVDTFASNPFGLCGMHGNAAEWTRSTYAPYPYNDTDGRNRAVFTTNEWLSLKKVVRGGSCLDREKRATASFRTAMYAWQRGYNVGFRVVADTIIAASVPTAAFSASPTNGLVDLTVTFDGRASSDPGGPIWKFA